LLGGEKMVDEETKKAIDDENRKFSERFQKAMLQ